MSDTSPEASPQDNLYKAPVLTELGSVQLLTLGGTQSTTESMVNQTMRMV